MCGMFNSRSQAPAWERITPKLRFAACQPTPLASLPRTERNACAAALAMFKRPELRETTGIDRGYDRLAVECPRATRRSRASRIDVLKPELGNEIANSPHSCRHRTNSSPRQFLEASHLSAAERTPLKKLGEKTFDGLTNAVGRLLDATAAEHCLNFFKACGYG